MNVPRPVNQNAVNPLLPNLVSLTFILISVSALTLNRLAAVNLLQPAANRFTRSCVAGSNGTAAAPIPALRITAVHQLQKLVVLLLPKHVPHQPLRLAVLLLLKHVPLRLQKPAVLLLLKHVPHRLLRLAVLQLPKAAAPLLRPVLLRLQIPAATNSLAATLILAKSLN
ncbi:MAG: hypothetical protein ACF8CY_05720 [Gimesia chilikensis]